MGKQHCGQNINTEAILGKRSAPKDCSVCCSTDHCNLEACQNNNSGDVYQLNSKSPGVDCQDSDPALCATMGRHIHTACKEPSIVRTCPKSCDTCDHIGWGTWQSWGQCSKSCGTGRKTRVRSCLSRLSNIHQQNCVGSSTSTASCLIHCPVNGGGVLSQQTVEKMNLSVMLCKVYRQHVIVQLQHTVDVAVPRNHILFVLLVMSK